MPPPAPLGRVGPYPPRRLGFRTKPPLLPVALRLEREASAPPLELETQARESTLGVKRSPAACGRGLGRKVAIRGVRGRGARGEGEATTFSPPGSEEIRGARDYWGQIELR